MMTVASSLESMPRVAQSTTSRCPLCRLEGVVIDRPLRDRGVADEFSFSSTRRRQRRVGFAGVTSSSVPTENARDDEMPSRVITRAS